MPQRRRDKDRALARQQDPPNATFERFQATITRYQGPLPPVEMLRDLDVLVPGAAERSLTLFEDQARHRMDLERRAIGSDIMQSRLGLCAGFVLALVGISGAIYLISIGHSQEGFGTLFTTVAALVGTFVYGTKSRKDERLEKAGRQQQLKGPQRRR